MEGLGPSCDELDLACGGVGRTGWWFCIEARSANVSILCVEEVRAKLGWLTPVGTGEMSGDEFKGR